MTEDMMMEAPLTVFFGTILLLLRDLEDKDATEAEELPLHVKGAMVGMLWVDKFEVLENLGID